MDWMGRGQRQDRLQGSSPVRDPTSLMVSPGVTQAWSGGPTVQDTKAERGGVG